MNPQAPDSLGPSRARLRPTDLVLAILLGVLALTDYVLTPIVRGYGDGPNLIGLFADPDNLRPSYNHALYLPLARALKAGLALFGVEPSAAGTLLFYSQLSTALGLSCSLLCARALGIARVPALLATLLFAVSPPVWFYASVPEVHAPHFAAVSFVALLTLIAPWRRPILATGLLCIAMPVLFLTHQTGLFFFPGWIFLVQLARSRFSAPFAQSTLFLRIAPSLVLSFGLALLFNATLRDISLDASLSRSSAAITTHNGPVLEGIWLGWIQPLALLWLPLLAALFFRTRDELAKKLILPLALVFLPNLIFFLAWGVPERGGYTLGGGVFLIIFTSLGLAKLNHASSRRATISAIALGTLLILGQAALARHQRNLFDDPVVNQSMQERIDTARIAFGDNELRHVLLSFDHTNQTISARAPEIQEVRLRVALSKAAQKNEPPSAFASFVVELLQQLHAAKPVVTVLDRSYAVYLTDDSIAVQTLQATEERIREEFDVVEFSGPGGGFWKLTPLE